MRGSAEFSPCGKYRYRLARYGLAGELFRPAHETLTFVMLNPSTADAWKLDPTVRRCVGYAQREVARTLIVGNLFAARSTDPTRLLGMHDPIGPGNAAALRRMLTTRDPVVIAWGVLDVAPASAASQVRAVRAIALEVGTRLFCLGQGMNGEPRHPLFMPKATRLIPWNVERWAPA